MTRRAKTSDDGSTPLRNKRHEAFCAARVNMTIPDAWGSTLGPDARRPSRASLKSAGFKVNKRPEVQRRIAYLRKEAEAARREIEVPDVIRRSDIAAISLEVTEALEAAYVAASAANPTTREALARVWAAHLGRQGKLTEEDGAPPEETSEDVLAGIRRLEEWAVCNCK